MAKILGLDLGTNSIGWAVVEKERDSEFQLIDKGVHIFQEGVKIEKGQESSKAAERTSFRSARRLKYRRKLRKIQVLQVLSEYGFCPKLEISDLKRWRYQKKYPMNSTFLDWQKTDEATQKNPYYFRAMAVETKFDLNDEGDCLKLGRAFYHMAQRRGFLSNRLEGTKESEGAVTKAISEINEAKGDKTLGQYFYGKYQKGEKIRDTYTHREEHYLDEFNRICDFQSLPEKIRTSLQKAIFYQRPLKSQKGGVGRCVFEPKKPRCPVSRPEFEEYRMLCFINNIKIKTPEDEKLRELTLEEQLKIRTIFFRKSDSKKVFDFEDIAKQLAPKKQYKFYKAKGKYPEDWLFNFSMNTSVSGCPVSARFKDIFGDEFLTNEYLYVKDSDDNLSKRVIDAWHALYTFDSNEKLQEFAHNTLGLNDEQTKEYLKAHLKQDYASLSLKAIRKIVPYLNDGLIYSHAVFLANMSSAIPSEVWKDQSNRKLIRNEIRELIDTQNEEKQLIEIVNGIIKRNRDDEDKDKWAVWSEEAKSLLLKDLYKKIETYYGKNRYASFDVEKRERIEKKAGNLFEQQMQKNMGKGEFAKIETIDARVRNFLVGNFHVDENSLQKLYHPSAIETYKPPIKGEDGKLYLGSPMVSSVKNPMAMRALHQLRKLINELIRNDQIDANTKIHIEMARGLKNANERAALKSWQNSRETLRKSYAEKINEHFKANGINREPADDEILKYELWEEQQHICLYTGKNIGIEEFLGSNPAYDIEHTIPRSLSLDNSMQNKTLCQNRFNRAEKRNKIPSKLKNHEEILQRIEPWREKYLGLEKQINAVYGQVKKASEKETKDKHIRRRHELKFEHNYWRNKYRHFTMEDVPDGFKNSQMVDIGIINKYSRLYLRTLFSKVYTVKGSTVADFRKFWGLQEEYEKKGRSNHIHHCIDAITIACITKENYESLANFYHDWEEYWVANKKDKPQFNKPWRSFAEDLKEVEKEVLISHYTPDVLPKQSKKKLRSRGKIEYLKKYKKDADGNYLLDSKGKKIFEDWIYLYDINGKQIPVSGRIDEQDPDFRIIEFVPKRGGIDVGYLVLAPNEHFNVPDCIIKKEIRAKYVKDKTGKIIYHRKPVYLQGDSARGSLHQQTFYGAVAHDKEGKVTRDSEGNIIPKYVVRKHLSQTSLSPLKAEDIKNIVDQEVRNKIEHAVSEKGFKNAMDGVIWMNEEKEISIKKVRVYATSVRSPLNFKHKKQRDKSSTKRKPYKEEFNVVNDGNYLMALYQKQNEKGKILRDYKILNNLSASEFYKYSAQKNFKTLDINIKESLLRHDDDEFRLYQILMPGKLVLLWKDSPRELLEADTQFLYQRLYTIRGLDDDGIKLYFHSEARQTTDVIKYMNDVITKENIVAGKIDVKKAQKLLSHHGINTKDKIKPIAQETEDGSWLILDSNNQVLLEINSIEQIVKESKLSTPKGGDVIDKAELFPYVKFKPSNFNGLVEGIDFKISSLGKITRLKL